MLLVERQPVDESTRRALRYWWCEDGSTLDRVLTGRRRWDVVWWGEMMRSHDDPEMKLVGVALSMYQSELGDPAPFPSYTQLAADSGFRYHDVTWVVPSLISHGWLTVDLPLPAPEDNAPRQGAAGVRRKAGIPKELRWAVWERDDFTCQNCGARRDLAIDHIHPESAGGATALENLQTLCVPCNSAKGARVGVVAARRMSGEHDARAEAVPPLRKS